MVTVSGPLNTGWEVYSGLACISGVSARVAGASPPCDLSNTLVGLSYVVVEGSPVAFSSHVCSWPIGQSKSRDQAQVPEVEKQTAPWGEELQSICGLSLMN